MIDPRPLNDMEKSIVDGVEKHGCFIMSVFDPDGIKPNFSYSIGFENTSGQPEVIVFSLPKDFRASMINELYRQIAEDSLDLKDGLRIKGLLVGHDCVARKVTSPEAIAAHFGSAIWFNRRYGSGEMTHIFQIVWPGAHEGLFPWESGCSQSVIDDQPALYEGRTIH